MDRLSYLHADKLPAISAFDSGFDDFIVRDPHVNVGDREQCQADSSEVE